VAKGRSWTAAAARRAVIAALLVWLVVGTAKTYPYYVAYFNELTGGPANGFKYLTDSNLDWGQDLKGLGEYLRQRDIAMVRLAYFGSDDPRRFGINFEPLRPGQPVTGYVAVSASVLTGTFHYPGCVSAFDWLRPFEPVAKIGYSIFVYRIPDGQHLPHPTSLPQCDLHDALMGRFL
jgi:hypothetical protein